MAPRRTRIHEDQVHDEGFVSEAEFNEFFGQVVITGTDGIEDTMIQSDFDGYLPGRGIFVGSDGNVVSTGTNTINIAGFYTEFVASSGTLQGQIDGLGGGGNNVTSITASGVTITGGVTLASIEGIDLIPDAGTSTITISGTPAEAGAVSPESILYIYEGAGGQSITTNTAVTFDSDSTVDTGYSFTAGTSTITFDVAGDYEVTYSITTEAQSGGTGGAQRTNVDQWMEEDTGGGFTEIPGTRSMSYVRGSVFGAEGTQTFVRTFAVGDQIRLVADVTAGSAPVTVKADGASLSISPARAIGAPGPEGPQGPAGGVVDITASGTTLSGSIILEGEGGNSLYVSGQTIVISGSSSVGPGQAVTSLNGLTDDVTIAAGDNVSINTASQTITISSTDTDTISDAIVGGVGITVTSGSNETTIDGHVRYDKSENDAIIGGYGAVVTSGANTITIDTFDDDDIDTITVSGVTMSGSVTFATVGGTTITPDNSDTDNPVITISGGASVGELVGSLFQIEFTNGGNTSNTWLAVSDSNLSGNQTPWTACFPCRLAGLSFSNRNTGADLDMEIHVAREGDGNSSTLEYTWSIVNGRTAFKTDIPTTELVLDPGDKVSVYAAGAGGSGRDVWLGVFWEIVSRTTSEGVENWSGSIS